MKEKPIAGRKPVKVTMTSTPVVPFWYRTPEQQLERAKEFWPGLNFPEPPVSFIPKTKSEVLLLHVPQPLGELWAIIGECSESYTIGGQWLSLTWYANENLVLAPKAQRYRIPVWVAFDPDYGRGKCLQDLYDNDNMAASEVMSAIIQFPEWPLTWVYDPIGPCMVGYRYQRPGERDSALAMYLSTNTDPVKLEPYHISQWSRSRVLSFPTARRV